MTIKVPCLTGATIKRVRQISPKEIVAAGFVRGDGASVIELSTGVTLVAWCDPEGNGIGHLTGQFQGQTFDIIPEGK